MNDGLTVILSDISITLLSLVLLGCGKGRDESAWWAGERERIGLAHQVQLADYRAGRLASGGPAQLSQLQGSLRELGVRQQLLRQRRVALTTEIAALARQSDEFSRVTTQNLRFKLVGRQYNQFQVADGRTFHQVTITKVDDGGVEIRHDSGAARLRYAALSPDQRDMFGLAANSARDAEQQELLADSAYEHALQQELQTANANLQAAADVTARIQQTWNASPMLALESPDPFRQPATPVGRRSWSYNYYGYSSQPTYRYMYSKPMGANSSGAVRSTNAIVRSQQSSQTYPQHSPGTEYPRRSPGLDSPHRGPGTDSPHRSPRMDSHSTTNPYPPSQSP